MGQGEAVPERWNVMPENETFPWEPKQTHNHGFGEGMAVVFSDEQCYRLNASQHDESRHPYTCGKNSRHRPLIATRFGWRCADCEYRQDWAHGG